MKEVNGIQEFVSYVVNSLADRPERVNVSRREEGGRHIFDVRVDEEDIARLLGRSGNTVLAVRNLASAAAAHHGITVGVEVLE
jgi:uncharacterized protein